MKNTWCVTVKSGINRLDRESRGLCLFVYQEKDFEGSCHE